MLNMGFSKAVCIRCNDQQWLPSPMLGVMRKPLAREDAERGHATSIVKYDAGSVFRAHPHPQGEEILVLQGTFCDEHGAYPAGAYFRNPPGSSHAPFSPEGCILFVKLHQFQSLDSEHVLFQENTFANLAPNSFKLLHQFNDERVGLLRVSSAQVLGELLRAGCATEILLIQGELELNQQHYEALSWFRIPETADMEWHFSNEILLWVKQGHF